jgi:hypothetical protein
VIAMDYIIPLLGAKRYGVSKWGVWGSVLAYWGHPLKGTCQEKRLFLP